MEGTNVGMANVSRTALAQIFFAVPTPVFLCEYETGKILAANDAFTRWVDLGADSVLGRSLPQVLSLRAPEQWERALREPAEQSEVEIETTTPSGDPRICACRIARVDVDSCNYRLVSLQDVTHRARAEASLREAEEEARRSSDALENLLDAIPDVIGVQDRHHRVLRYNAAGYRFLKIGPKDLGRKCYEYLGRDKPCAQCATSRAIETGQPAQLEKYVPELDIWIEARAYPLVDESGHVKTVIEHLRDITLQRRSAQEREKLFALSLDLICVAGFDGYFKQVNPAWTKTLGWSTDELLARPWMSFVHPEDQQTTREAGERLASGESVIEFENRYQCRDGSYRLLSWNSFPLVPEGIIYAVVRDLTETRRLQERLQQAEKMDIVGKLAGGIAHDFNNQLVGILGYADLLALDAEDPKLRAYAEGISAAARRSSDLTQSLLAFARKGKLKTERIDVHQVLRDIVALLEHTLGRHIVIRATQGADRFVVLGDGTQLQSALLNLAVNARDAMPDGGELHFSTHVERIGEQANELLEELDVSPGPYLCIAVADSGMGMDERTRAQLFEPFFTTKAPGKGLGLGLAAVYGTVRSHGGAVTVQSEPDHGTTFRVYLPLHDSPVAPDAAGPNRHTQKQKSTARVLVVDDEQVVRELTGNVLEKAGCKVTAFASGREAIAWYEHHWRETDVVVLDMVMPHMSGRQVFAGLRSINPSVRAIVVTGFSLEGDARGVLEDGALAVLQKPFRIADLLDAIESALS